MIPFSLLWSIIYLFSEVRADRYLDRRRLGDIFLPSAYLQSHLDEEFFIVLTNVAQTVSKVRRPHFRRSETLGCLYIDIASELN